MAGHILYPSGDFPFELLHSELVRMMVDEEKAAEEETEKAEKEEEERLLKGTPQDQLTHSQANAKRLKYPFGRVNATTKLEFIGYRVGYAISERIAKDYPRFNSELDMMKFMCKDFWSNVFRKQVDNLRTNHQGVYVIQDNKFWLLESFSSTHQYRDDCPKYVALSCGLIRGALANLGIQALVTATVETMPAVKFNVHVQQK